MWIARVEQAGDLVKFEGSNGRNIGCALKPCAKGPAMPSEDFYDTGAYCVNEVGF